MQAVILSFNHPDLTTRAVLSALRFFKNPILVHNGSEQENIDRLKNAFPQVHHIVAAKNLGFSGGANLGLKEAFKEHEWALFITNDCELLSIDSRPADPGIYAPLIYRRQTTKIDSLGAAINLKKLKLRHLTDEQDELTNDELFYVPGTAFWIDDRTFNALGGFDESLGTYLEDVDFCLRAKELNIKLSTQSETKLMHKVGKTCHKDPYYTNYLFPRNLAVIARRHSSRNAYLQELLVTKYFLTRIVSHAKSLRLERMKISAAAYVDSKRLF